MQDDVVSQGRIFTPVVTPVTVGDTTMFALFNPDDHTLICTCASYQACDFISSLIISHYEKDPNFVRRLFSSEKD